MESESYFQVLWKEFKKNKIGLIALYILSTFIFIGLYAPFFASSKPLLVYWQGHIYFPLLRYLFYQGFYTKSIDLFFNLLMMTFPLMLACFFIFKQNRKSVFFSIAVAHTVIFIWLLTGAVKNPASDSILSAARQMALEKHTRPSEDPLLATLTPQTTWQFDLQYIPDHNKLTQLLNYKYYYAQHERLSALRQEYEDKTGREMPTLWSVWQRNEKERENELHRTLEQTKESYFQAHDRIPLLIEAYKPYSHAFTMAKYTLEHAKSEEEKKEAERLLSKTLTDVDPYRKNLVKAQSVISQYQKAYAEISYLKEKNTWLEQEAHNLRVLIPPLLRTFHWEEDAGGAQEANQYIPWWELTRVNRKDLVASLLFGIRISLVVGILAIFLSLIIGIPLGMVAGYFVGKMDLVICRVIEMWEAMPTFFMLLLIVAITQSKSIFLVIVVLGLFGWTGFSRFIRAEMLKQRNLPYVDACRSLGYSHHRIMFSHILPNAIPPILTLLPFAMMSAITSEAGLSFLGLGEEGSSSWGVLMDEGRSVFPSESYLLWPPAILLTILLVSIALVGDALRDAIDPKLRQ